MIIAAHEHSQPERSHQYVASLYAGNRISPSTFTSRAHFGFAVKLTIAIYHSRKIPWILNIELKVGRRRESKGTRRSRSAREFPKRSMLWQTQERPARHCLETNRTSDKDSVFRRSLPPNPSPHQREYRGNWSRRGRTVYFACRREPAPPAPPTPLDLDLITGGRFKFCSHIDDHSSDV
ncbi:hypothetical protein EVAR_26517_1 [Eumeta japonica]|uniref:Uncharacterized protein n=1 Tax=Eumeta variegata TaxID=151549 RepID=A0A4C1V8R8_EUMVA|nr:hypothetical protein EVAR_26517_1 [Eumeta japonica]